MWHRQLHPQILVHGYVRVAGNTALLHRATLHMFGCIVIILFQLGVSAAARILCRVYVNARGE